MFVYLGFKLGLSDALLIGNLTMWGYMTGHLLFHRILNWPDTRPPDIRPICFAGYTVAGLISG